MVHAEGGWCSDFSGASPAAREAAEGDGEGEGERAERPEEREGRAHPHQSNGKRLSRHFLRQHTHVRFSRFIHESDPGSKHLTVFSGLQ